MIKKKLKIYLDSSVPNYVFNDEYPEKQNAARLLFNAIKKKRIIGLLSPETIREIKDCNEHRRGAMMNLVRKCQLFPQNPAAEALVRHYIKQKVFAKRNHADARHLAYAVYHAVDIVVSYNFKHIVKLSVIKKLQSANLLLGFKTPEIRSPEEIDL